MWKLIKFLFFPLMIFASDLEVPLATRASLTPVYVNTFHAETHDWRQFEEYREILVTDLNRSGFASVMQREDYLEKTFQFSEVKGRFDLSIWKKEKIPFCLAAQILQNKLEVTAFNISQGTSKKYPLIPLERRAIHQLADAIQKDFFGVEGISSLKLIYTLRTKSLDAKGLEWLSEVWTCDADGASPTQITKENSYSLCPAFFPRSSTEFFYVSEKSGQSKIYRASLSKPKGELMVDLRGNQVLATLKGTQMAFITDVAGRPDLFIQSLDSSGRMMGKARQLFSAPRATQASPTFSPDGKKIAFVSDKDGPPRLYLLDVADVKSTRKPHPQLLTKRNRENTSPSWSPDGRKLAYSAKVDEIRQIWLYDFSTGEETPLTTGPENKENPSWAPDSFHLVYNTESEDHCDLYLIDLNQKEPAHIGKGRFASWQER